MAVCTHAWALLCPSTGYKYVDNGWVVFCFWVVAGFCFVLFCFCFFLFVSFVLLCVSCLCFVLFFLDNVVKTKSMDVKCH